MAKAKTQTVQKGERRMRDLAGAGEQPKRVLTPENCTHKDENGEWTVVIDGQYEECTQCGLIGK